MTLTKNSALRYWEGAARPVLFPEIHSQGHELHPTIIAPKAREITYNEALNVVLLD